MLWVEHLTGNRVMSSIPVRDSGVFSSEKKETCDSKGSSFTVFIQAAKLLHHCKYCYYFSCILLSLVKANKEVMKLRT